jgi:hypothetical protein
MVYSCFTTRSADGFLHLPNESHSSQSETVETSVAMKQLLFIDPAGLSCMSIAVMMGRYWEYGIMQWTASS